MDDGSARLSASGGGAAISENLRNGSSRGVGLQPAADDHRGPVHIEVRNLEFSRGSRSVFQGLSCSFLRDRITVILGGSGSGKTTLLRMLGCLNKPDRGEIWVDGETELTQLDAADARQFRRRIGMMFQYGALLDSMTIYDNIALPLREHTSMTPEQIRREVGQVFDSVELHDVDGLLPAELSGGMRKRAALARSLILAPDILLCDEPFSGLDPRTVRVVEALLVAVNQRLGVTMIIASHHIHSTLRMADQIVLLVDGGAIAGTPAEFLRSEDPRVVEFLADEASDPRAVVRDLEEGERPYGAGPS